MTIKGRASIAGIYEHPLRKAPDHSVGQLHAEVAAGALADAGLEPRDVDAYFCAGDAPGFGPMSMADYLGLKLRHLDSTEIGGASYILHVAHAAQAIALGKARVALITMAGRPLSEKPRYRPGGAPESGFEAHVGISTHTSYGMCAARHMHEFGTTSEQLAWVKAAASIHASHNPHAMLKDQVSVEDVLASPIIADPLHRLDCCITSDGGGAIVVVHPDVAKELGRPTVTVLGAGEGMKGPGSGCGLDLTYSAAAGSGPRAFEEAGVTPSDIDYASVYDSFTITVLMQLEDLGFCAKGKGGAFVADGGLVSGQGRLAVNTDGGGLCNNHPSFRGGVTKVIEAVRQLRGEAAKEVQVPDARLAVATGIGGSLAGRHGAATVVLERSS